MARESMDPQRAFAELGRIRLAETDLQGVLERVAELAKAALPSADEVSVTLIRDSRPHTAAFTGDVAIRLDEMQYAQGQGPCLQAAEIRDITHVRDMRVEGRWPDYTPIAVERGVLSSLSVGLPVQGTVRGALNIYAESADAFDDGERSAVTTFADFAAVALANADLYHSTATLAHQMQEALAGRAVIEQAKGIVMGERRCGADEAFAVLALMSQQSNRKLRDVATDLVEQTRHS